MIEKNNARHGPSCRYAGDMRPKSTARDLPPRLLRRTKTLVNGTTWTGYYYNGRAADGRRVEIPLGTNLEIARRKWAELEAAPPARPATPAPDLLMAAVIDRYEREVLPGKAVATQKNQLRWLQALRRSFGAIPVDAISPHHVAQYRDRRKLKAGVSANRELSLLSHVYNKAREWGLTTAQNPCVGVERVKESPRDYYLDDGVWAALYAAARQDLKDAMDLAYLTGQRPADVLKMRLSDIRDGALEVQQNKTRIKLRILLSNAGQPTGLGQLIERLRSRPGKVASLYLLARPADGSPLTIFMIQQQMERARERAAEEAKDPLLRERILAAQFRDIRPKAASDHASLAAASDLLGHTQQEITKRVYRRIGKTVLPTK